MIQLKPLQPRGVIGIMAPSSPVDEEKLQNGVSYFEKAGYRVHVTPGCKAEEHYLAGSPEMRAGELMKLHNDPDIDAIFFARGGFGSAAMLPLLDYKAIGTSRKLMVGFSDITALQWGIYARTRLPSLSAGMPAVDFCKQPPNPQFEEIFWKFMETGKMEWELPGSSLLKPLHDTSGDNAVVRGIALPGTLSVATMLAGTPWLPDFRNTIPFFEDVGESRHKIDGNLLQARLGGWFEKCKGVIFGDFKAPDEETFPDNPALEVIFERSLAGYDFPVITGFPYGHIDRKIPVPVGQEISLSLGSSVKISSTDSLFAH